jgi:hypothetical protein
MKATLFGQDSAGATVEVTPKERLAHMHVIGSSGSGKSKFLEQLIRQDLKSGQGFCVIDPHGSLYKDVLDFASYKVARQKIILLDLSKPDFVIGFNPFRKADDGDISVQVDRRISAIMHAWGVENTDQTPTLERTLSLIFTTLLELNLSFQEAQYLVDFNASEMRSKLVEQLSSPLIRREWEELEQLKAKDWRSEVLSAKNRLYRLLTSKTLGRFFAAQANPIDLAEIIESGKVLLVNLAPSDHLSTQNARIFGSLLVNEFFEVALRRNATNPKLKPYYLYLDEFQTFVGIDIADMLDQVRKFKLFTVLAHQRFGQVNENVKDAVLTNCKIKAVFGGLSVEVARMMALELCIGRLDPMQVKHEIYQTKFRPVYTRDKVYSRSISSGRSTGTGENESSGSASASMTGIFYTPDNGWVSYLPESASHSESTSSSSGSQHGHHSNQTDFDGFAESEADVPMMRAEEFKELSSIQYMSLEEQLVLLTAAIKEQPDQSCIVKIHSKPARRVFVPFIKSHYIRQSALQWYRTRLLGKGGAVSVEEVDAANNKEHEKWKTSVSEKSRAKGTDEAFWGRE